MRNIKSFELNNGDCGIDERSLVSYAVKVNSEKRMCPLGD